MAETKKKATKKTTTTKKTAPKKSTKVETKKESKKIIDTNTSEIKEKNRLSSEAAFSVWVDILILIFIVLMFAVVLYGYIIAK